METSVLIVAYTTALMLILRRELVAAVRSPTPARSLTLMSAAYLVGAAIVHVRDSSDLATFLFTAYALHFGMYLVGFSILSAALRLRLDPKGVLDSGRRVGPLAIAAMWALLMLTLGATVYAVIQIGADRVLSALYQFVVFGQVDVSVLELRLALASGEERWIAPGYLKQLRDILLPLTVLIVLFAVKRKAAHFLSLAVVLIPLVSILIISSGERGPVLFFLAAVMYAAGRAIAWNVQSARSIFVPMAMVGVVALGTFFALTYSFESRYDEDVSVPVVLVDRIVTRVPEENLHSAPLWIRGAPFPGAGWLSDISTVLPGTQQTLSNLLHEHLGGGDRGNSVLGAWIEVHYNFGWALGMAVSLSIGFMMAIFNHWVNESRSVSRAADICGLWISICMLFVLSPFGFLLYGPFTLSSCLLLIVLGHSGILSPFIGEAPARSRAT